MKGRRPRKWAKGRKAFGICDRTGFKVPYHKLVKEPGTGLLVDRRWSDGKWNRVDHPLNFPADTSEAISLRDPRPDRIEPNPNFVLDENNNFILADGQPVFY